MPAASWDRRTSVRSPTARATVRIANEQGKEFTYVIAGATEADPFNGKISDESPVGKAILGLKVGEKGEATLPNGTVALYTVLEISK